MYYSLGAVLLALFLFVIWFFIADESDNTSGKFKKSLGIVAFLLFIAGGTASYTIYNIQQTGMFDTFMRYVVYNPQKDTIENSTQGTNYTDVWTLRVNNIFNLWTLQPCKVYTLVYTPDSKEVIHRTSDYTEIIQYLRTYYAGNAEYWQKWRDKTNEEKEMFYFD